MAGIKISALPAVASALTSDFFPVVQGGVTSKETLLQVGTLFGFDSGTGLLSLAKGGTNANLTAALGAIPYSTASAFAFLAPGSSGQVLRSGGAGAPTWSTSTFPATAGAAGNVLISNGTNYISSTSLWPNTVGAAGKLIRSDGTTNAYTTLTFPDTIVQNAILFGNVANNLGPITPAASSALVSSAGNVPSWSTVLPALTTADPVVAQGVATKAYVDAVAQGLNPKPASQAASTVALTVTYNNGASGIGATLTNAGAQAAFAIDGYTAALNDVILIKDQASTLQNGLYTLTTLGSGASNWVLTRSVFMDAPSEFLGGYTFVINGTVNAGRSYVETATVTAVGTDPVTFVQFSQSKQLSVVAQVITGSATYTPTTGMQYCIVEIVGSGGGSGGSAGAVGQTGSSGGGGGGGYCKKLYTSVLIGANAAVVIGAAGAAGTAGNNNGGNGGNSTFTPAGAGVVLTAGGGVAGLGAASSATVTSTNGGSGGTATNGDVNIPGNNGSQGQVILGSAGSNLPGIGGGTPLSPGGTINNSFSGSVASKVYGSGGAGIGSSGVDVAGAAGALGICIVTEYVLT